MKKTTRYIALTGVASLLLWTIGSTGFAVDRSLLSVPKRITGLALSAQAAGQAQVTVLLSTQRNQTGAVARTVRQLGGTVRTQLADADFLVARVPADSLQTLERSALVRAMALDRPVRLDPTAMKPLTETRKVASATDPALSLKVTRGEIRAPQFSEQTGADGNGVVIAVLDTGVDPAHPALLRTPAGTIKITDWQDFTGEGDVATAQSLTEPIAGIASQGGTYRLGAFREAQIPNGEMGSDINRNGKNDDEFKVLLSDTVKGGVYDTAYVDTNQNGDFTDEKPLQAYNQSHAVAAFGPAEAPVNFVVTRINNDGSGLNLGYDGGQHGTHVAGIAAGSGPLTGVAPGAQVMAIKVLTSGGSGSWAGIIQGMHYAASKGARVINMSLGGMADLNDGNDPQSLFIKDLTTKSGALFSIAAGNSGPGLNTMGLPGVAGAAITSGAFISSNTWKVDYGLDVPQDGLWYFSSAGPRDDGGLKPNIVAPGTANSAIPTWAGDYAVFQGTSMAAPQTSGAAALLMSAAQYRGIKSGPQQFTQALELGSRRLPGYGWFEQGYGLIQVDAAWQLLPRLAAEAQPDLISFGKAKAGTTGTGIYARDYQLSGKDSKWTIGNRELKRQQLQLTYLPGKGLSLAGPASVNLPPLQRREIPLQMQSERAPGVYDALVQARISGQTGYASQFLTTVVVPHEFEAEKGNVISGIAGAIGPARYARHFVRVPAGTAELALHVKVPNNEGRVRLMAYTPDGMPAGGTNFAGAPNGPERQTLVIENPAPGVWEIDAYGSHGSMSFGLSTNRYTIEVAAKGVYASPAKIDLPLAFGQSLTRKLNLANYYGDLRAAAVGVGFARPQVKRMELESGNYEAIFFDVTEGTAMLRASLGQVLDPTADMALGLYYHDAQRGGWVPVGRQQGLTIDHLNPKAGKYAVEIGVKSATMGKVPFQYSLTHVTGGSNIVALAPAADRPFGARWSVPVTIKVPYEFGQYLGAVTVTDENTGRVLTVVPIEVR